MRMIVIKQETDLQTLSGKLLNARLTSDKADSAVRSLQTLNPHVDLNKIAAGTVLLVPDAPGFKTSASDSIPGNVLGDLQQLVQTSLGDAASKLKLGNADRDARRAEVAAVLKSAAVQRLVATDPELKQQLDEATKAIKQDQANEALAAQSLETATKGAQSELAAVAKLLD